MAKKNQSKNESKNQSANALQYTTYTGQSGKTIAVVTGFTGKEDPRVEYIAQVGKDGEPSAVHGRFTALPIGGEERVPCVMWGVDTCWGAVAKAAAAIFSDFEHLTEEAYDALIALADKAYEQRKAEGQAQDAERKAKGETAKPKAQPAKGKTKTTKAAKPAGKKGSTAATTAASKETSTAGAKAKKPAAPKATAQPAADLLYTAADLRAALDNAFAALAKSLKVDKAAFDPIIANAVNAAKAAKQRKAA